MWEKSWRYRGMPKIGDYVCCKVICDGVLCFDEGLVIEVQGAVIRLHNDPPIDPDNLYPNTIAWKKWRGPEVERKIFRKQQESTAA